MGLGVVSFCFAEFAFTVYKACFETLPHLLMFSMCSIMFDGVRVTASSGRLGLGGRRAQARRCGKSSDRGLENHTFIRAV